MNKEWVDAVTAWSESITELTSLMADQLERIFWIDAAQCAAIFVLFILFVFKRGKDIEDGD